MEFGELQRNFMPDDLITNFLNIGGTWVCTDNEAVARNLADFIHATDRNCERLKCRMDVEPVGYGVAAPFCRAMNLGWRVVGHTAAHNAKQLLIGGTAKRYWRSIAEEAYAAAEEANTFPPFAGDSVSIDWHHPDSTHCQEYKLLLPVTYGPSGTRRTNDHLYILGEWQAPFVKMFFHAYSETAHHARLAAESLSGSSKFDGHELKSFLYWEEFSSRQQLRKCHKCDEVLGERDKFCSSCGAAAV